jgi:hypothetical protein
MKRLSIVVSAVFMFMAAPVLAQTPPLATIPPRAQRPVPAASPRAARPMTAPALAQRPARPPVTPDDNVVPAEQSQTPVKARTPAEYPRIALSELQATPEMWFYEQSLRQYQDPKMAVRQAAEFRAEQRQRRLESMKWYGLSNQRPRANSDPFNNDYAPRWAGNNEYYPDRWSGVSGGPAVVVVPDAAYRY